MNLLIIGDRQPHNDADGALTAFMEAGHDVTFVHPSPIATLPFAVAAEETDFIGQARSLIRSRQIDLIYFRADASGALYRAHADAIFAADFGVPIVLGYQGHTGHPWPLERASLTRADAIVLTSEASASSLSETYGLDKPTMLVPSLFLPRRSFYEVPLRSKRSADDGVPHVVIASEVLRIAGVPRRPDPNVPIESYVLDRNDYLNLTEQLLRRGVAVTLFGGFDDRDEEGEPATTAYGELASRFPGRMHFPKRVDPQELPTELSQFDAAIFSGFVPYQPVPKLHHVSDVPQFHTALAARLPIFIAAGTAASMEREIADTGAGFVFESINELTDRLRDDAAIQRASNAAHDAQDRHSIEHHVPAFISFFEQVMRSYRNRSSSRAA